MIGRRRLLWATIGLLADYLRTATPSTTRLTGRQRWLRSTPDAHQSEHIDSLRAIHLSRLRWCDAVPRLAGWCPVPAFARRVPIMVHHGRGLLGLSGVAALAGRVRLPTM